MNVLTPLKFHTLRSKINWAITLPWGTWISPVKNFSKVQLRQKPILFCLFYKYTNKYLFNLLHMNTSLLSLPLPSCELAGSKKTHCEWRVINLKLNKCVPMPDWKQCVICAFLVFDAQYFHIVCQDTGSLLATCEPGSLRAAKTRVSVSLSFFPPLHHKI